MQKKLLAVAVGSALTAFGAAPALAQNATVNVYGTFYGEFSTINNGAKSATEPYQTYDHFQNPGSEIGFRGEEKLGGGLSAWFQCASSLDYRGGGNASATNSQAGSYWCSRNSAIGLKGAFGNMFYGNWLTPWNRLSQTSNVGSNDTGVFGNAHIISGTSSTFGMSAPGQTNNTAGGTANLVTGVVTPGTTAINTVSPSVYRRRQNNLFTYETPNFSGFTGMAAITTRNNASAATNGQLKTRLWSVGAQYSNGPLFVGAAYEKHDNFYQQAVGVPGDDRGFMVGASYTFSNNLKLGGSYNDFKAQPALGVETKVKTFHVGIDWMISGPHGVRAGYSRAGDVKGPLGTAMNARPAAGPGTSADMWQIRYVFMASKRTEFTGGFSFTNNRGNATYETGGSSTTQVGGADSRAFAVAMKHSF